MPRRRHPVYACGPPPRRGSSAARLAMMAWASGGLSLDYGTPRYQFTASMVLSGTVTLWHAPVGTPQQRNDHVVTTQLLPQRRGERHRVGHCYFTIYLASTPTPARGRGTSAAFDRPQLSLRRTGVPGPRRRIARSAAGIRAFRRLRGHDRGDARIARIGVAVTPARLRRRLDLQPVGLG